MRALPDREIANQPGHDHHNAEAVELKGELFHVRRIHSFTLPFHPLTPIATNGAATSVSEWTADGSTMTDFISPRGTPDRSTQDGDVPLPIRRPFTPPAAPARHRCARCRPHRRRRLRPSMACR